MKSAKYPLLISVLLSACGALPVMTKTEAMQKVKEIYEISGNYADVTEYWDMNAGKCTIDGANAVQLNIDKDKQKSEIVISNGIAVYGIVEMIGDGSNKTKVIVHSWGAFACPDLISNFLKENFKVVG